MLTIACVYAKGPKYTEEWVDRLYRGLYRNLDIPFEFVCLSDAVTKHKTIPLISKSDNYWNKIELFRPNLFQGPVLYLDLDVVICKNITKEISQLPQDKFLMVKEPYRDIHNSSIMFWNGDYSYIYDQYINDKQKIINE